MRYDLIIYGGGTAGVAAAYIASKLGINTLVIEKTDVLGGSITQGLVIPSMKLNSQNINTEFISDLKTYADKYLARHTYINGNEYWFNPELLKIIFDEMLEKCNVLFSTFPIDICYNNNTKVFENFVYHKTTSMYLESKYIIDATANGIIFKLLNCDFQDKSETFQAPSLRFIMSGIDIKTFADWLENFDKDRNVTTVDRTGEQIHLSTACTWDNKQWALKPLFQQAINDGLLEYGDDAYFQVFTIPSMPGSLNFNAPRILLSDEEDISDPFVYSRALKQGREKIYRLYKFCKKYLKGFETAYISHISDILGVRESNRVKCRYTVKIDDIKNPKEFDNIAFACDYPIDIHTNKKETSKLQHVNNTYYIPIEALMSEKYENLYAVGRLISSEFEAQAALRTQISCFSMGEAVAKDIYKKISLSWERLC